MDISIFIVIALGATVLWRLFLAFLVMVDADRLYKSDRLFLNSLLVWIIAALIFGAVSLIVYWVIHYSVLSPANDGKMIRDFRRKRARRRGPVDDSPQSI